MPADLLNLLKNKLELESIPEPSSGCWLWLGRIDRNGYGQFKLPDRQNCYAHRASAFVYLNFDLNSSLFVCHKCDNPLCINPAHLFIGTQKDNMHDCFRKGRGNRHLGWAATNLSKTHCPQGHEYSGDNLIFDGGSRKCRTCVYSRNRERYNKKCLQKAHVSTG